MISPPLPEITLDPKISFQQAMEAVASGKRVTKKEWADVRRWVKMADQGLIYTHHPGEEDAVLHPWIFNDGDILGTDWVILPD
jgi:hypothetical protein